MFVIVPSDLGCHGATRVRRTSPFVRSRRVCLGSGERFECDALSSLSSRQKRRLPRRKFLATAVHSAEVPEVNEEELTIKKKEKKEKRGIFARMRNLVERVMGNDDLSLYSVPSHWKQQLKEASAKINEERLEKYYDKVAQINSLEAECREMPDTELKAKTDLFRHRLKEGESMESVLVEAFAIVRETSRRVLNMRHYDCQLVGGMVLHDGLIAEMATGEGKTLVATLPAYLNACAGKTVHVITVNEYLAERDAKWMGRIYGFLGLSVTSIKSDMSNKELQEGYDKEVIYVTAQKLCFDYLRDWSARSVKELVLSPLDYGIVDEVDSILIDESRNPMLISVSSDKNSDKFKTCAAVIYDLLEVQNYGLLNSLGNRMELLETLSKQTFKNKVPVADIYVVHEASQTLARIVDETDFLPKALGSEMLWDELQFMSQTEFLSDPENFKIALCLLLRFKKWTEENLLYKVDARARHATVTELGASLLKKTLEAHGHKVKGESGVALWETLVDGEPWGPFLMNAIKAYEFFILGKTYIVVNSRVTIVDEATGRMRENSRWEDSLHQAVEAKELVYQENKIQREGVDFDQPIKIRSADEAQASITFQVFFRYYSKLAGMSGTALSEEDEFFETYGLSVVAVPTHRPSRRVDHLPILFAKKSHKVSYLVSQLAQCRDVRPVLIGTNSVEESEVLMSQLQRDWVTGSREVVWDGENRHKQGKLLMLNARPEMVKEESRVIAQAGLPGMVTVATRMAGRGTDILLGGNPKGLTENALYRGVLDKCLPDANPSQSRLLPDFDLSSQTSLTAPPSIKGLMMTALLRSKATEDALVGADDAERLMTRVMTVAEDLRSDVLALLIGDGASQGSVQLMHLDFERNIRMAIATVLTKRESELEEETPFAQSMIKCALYAWLWFDQRCEAFAEQVRAAGGLLVISLSVAESKRIENQLRGRSGRQGDPGDSLMLADISDEIFQLQALGAVRRFVEMTSPELSSSLDGPLAEFIIDRTRSDLENISKAGRQTLANYDEVMEGFRQQCRFLKDIIIKGSHDERTLLLYTWIQDVANELVLHFTDGNRHPRNWKLWKRDGGDSLNDSLEEAIDAMFNPSERTSLFPFHDVRKQQYPSLEQFVQAGLKGEQEMNRLLKSSCRLPFVRVVPFTPYMQEDLNRALTTLSLPKASASAHFTTGRVEFTLEIRHALALHKKLIEQHGVAAEDRTQGKYAPQVRMLQEYVGELLIMLYEERKAQLMKDNARADDFTKQSVAKKYQIIQREIMLELLDILWTDFLKFTRKLRSTTPLASSGRTPLEEYSVESHRHFASELQNYRRAVVLTMATPSIALAADFDLNMWMDLIQSVASHQIKPASGDIQIEESAEEDVEVLLSDQDSRQEAGSSEPTHF